MPGISNDAAVMTAARMTSNELNKSYLDDKDQPIYAFSFNACALS